jgi:nicotinamide-nucleotide amidase
MSGEVDSIADMVGQLSGLLLERDWHLGVAESCTGGWIGKVLTDQAGSSRWFERGWLVYSNEAKSEMLGVDAALIAREGAVSQPVVEALVAGALARAPLQLALAVSGVAGPDGGSEDKPVGTVWFAWGVAGGAVRSDRQQFSGDREAVRAQAVAHALRGAITTLRGD